MTNQKKEDLEKMYALRAGLSVISQKCDDIDKIKQFENDKIINKKIDYLKMCAESNVFQRSSEQRKVEEEYYSMGDTKKYLTTDELRDKESEINNRLGRKYGYKLSVDIPKKEKKLITTSIFLSITCLMSVFLAFFLNAIFLFLTLACVIGLILSYLKLKKLKKEFNVKYQQYKEELEKEYSIFEKSYKEKIIKEYKTTLHERENMTQFCLQTKTHIYTDYDSCLNVLLDNYNNFLDIRDWENLDLIIYYYETGRADSVKEALQLVDNERRNNALIEAIGVATNEICRSIHSLGNIMIAGFSSLAAQLEAQRVQTMGALQQIDKNISGVLTQQTLSNALLAKANVSSKEMVEQMKKLNLKVK